MLKSLLAATFALTLLVSGCGGSDDPNKSPVGEVDVPEGTELTKPGTELDFGETATVAYQPNEKRRSVIEVTVQKVELGSIKHFGGYVLDSATRESTPYYVTAQITNIGRGDVGATPVPLWALDADDNPVQASSFTDTFRRCPSRPLPDAFPPQASTTGCLVFLIRDGGGLSGVTFRPLEGAEEIVWRGTVAGE